MGNVKCVLLSNVYVLGVISAGAVGGGGQGFFYFSLGSFWN